jgi:NAD(P)-dependent dehydrogenase (short-subunit alcohol dehydrogenase family)
MLDLTGRVAVVSGGASGIGEACVRRLADAGCRVVPWDLQPCDGGVLCDVSSPDSVAAAIAATERDYGPPSVLVAAAGVGRGQHLLEVDPAEWDRTFAVNMRGVMLTVQSVARSMIAHGLGGAMVLISSVNGVLADRGLTAYSASKAGVNQFARVAARELGPHGIRINALGPGATETPMLGPNLDRPAYREEVIGQTALGAFGQPSQIADAALGLLQMDWVTGQVLLVDGGASLNTGRTTGARPSAS